MWGNRIIPVAVECGWVELHRVELSIADVKRVMVASAGAWIEARPSPSFWFVGESERQAFVNLHLGEVTVTLDSQTEDLGEELR